MFLYKKILFSLYLCSFISTSYAADQKCKQGDDVLSHAIQSNDLAAIKELISKNIKLQNSRFFYLEKLSDKSSSILSLSRMNDRVVLHENVIPTAGQVAGYITSFVGLIMVTDVFGGLIQWFDDSQIKSFVWEEWSPTKAAVTIVVAPSLFVLGLYMIIKYTVYSEWGDPSENEQARRRRAIQLVNASSDVYEMCELINSAPSAMFATEDDDKSPTMIFIVKLSLRNDLR